jgi:hypothetical protein
MTRKEHHLIANVIRIHIGRESRTGRHDTVTALIDLSLSMAAELKRTSPNFHKDKFLTLCGWAQEHQEVPLGNAVRQARN